MPTSRLCTHGGTRSTAQENHSGTGTARPPLPENRGGTGPCHIGGVQHHRRRSSTITVLLTSQAPAASAVTQHVDPEAVPATASATLSSVPRCFMGGPDWLAGLYGEPSCRHTTP